MDDDLIPLPSQPTPGIYRHYKGNEYEVLFCVRHSETLEPMVVYKAQYGRQEVWARPQSIFVDEVIIDGTQVPRFTKSG